jgi:hypothetical protein
MATSKSQNILRTLKDPRLFISKLMIKDKKGKLAQLKPNDEQMKIIDAFENKKEHLVILKGRQIGSSTIVSAYLFWKWYTSDQPITIAILSHKLKSSQHILEMWFKFYDNLPSPLQRKLTSRNTTSMKLADSGAEVIAVSAEGHGGLRSFSANFIHLSEYAFAPDADELKATALGSLNEGRLIQESTANTFGDAHHQDVLKAIRGEANLELLFFPWTEHKEYSLKCPGNVIFSEEELGLIAKGLTPDQVYWRRIKVEQLGIHKFMREYPLTIDEAYGSSSNAYFTPDDMKYLSSVKIDHSDGALNVITPYSDNNAYAIGVDVSCGVGKDYSAIVVLDKATYNIAAVWTSNTTSVIDLADAVVHIATMYGEARVLIEENNIGAALLLQVRNLGYSNLWTNEITGKDWSTNVKTKWTMMEELKDAIRQGVINKIDMQTWTELRGFFINDKGNIDYPETLPTHGDQVIALGLALQCIKQVRLPDRLYLPPWLKHQIIQRKTKDLTLFGKRKY